MKNLNYILSLAGFTDINDFLGNHAYLFKPLLFISVTTGGVISFVETYSGIPIMLWVFLILGNIFDLGLGWYTNVIILKQPFESDKFFRGIMKSFVAICIVLFTNFLKLGVEDFNISYRWYKTFLVFTTSIIHYSFVFLIGLYVLLGVSENGEKLGIKVCKSINKILRMRINTVVDIGTNKRK